VQEARTTTALTGAARIARDMNDKKVVAVDARGAGPGWLFVELPNRRVDKILKRAEQTAKALGIRYPLSLLVRANEVIE
jgi:hypothetical protein